MEEERLTQCDFCSQQSDCGNIFIALRVLESEMGYCRDPQLLNRFEQLSNAIADQGYSYPKGLKQCKLANNALNTRDLLLRLRRLLSDVRAQAKIS